LLAVVAVFALAIKGFGYIPAIFFPPNDRPTFTVDLKLPVGTPIERTEEVVDEVESFMSSELRIGPSRKRGIVSWGTFIGEGAPRFILTYSPEKSAAEYAMIIANTTSRGVADEVMPKLERFCNENFPDLKATVRPLEMGPPTWPPIAVRISGREERRLFELVASVKSKLESIGGTKLIDDDWGARSKKILVQVDQERARRAGVTSQDVAISLQTFLSGFETTEYREGDKVIPVTMRSVQSERQDIGKLETLNIYAQSTGQSVPLKQVADIEVRWQASRIARYDRLKTVTVEAGLEPGVTASQVNASLVPWLEQQSASWPLGYSWALGGEAESSGESNAAIGAKLPFAGLIIVLLLVGQFNSIRRPIIIMFTVPLGLIGVVIGLLAAKSYFGFMTLLGVISLAGIVINNAIVLIDRIGLEIEDNGLSPDRAIVEAAQRRLRPIILTTGTTVGGLVPLWLGGGPMWEPMAISIIFGLIFATALTLGVVPVLYSVLFRVSFENFRYRT
ncbi:MAG: efflux RND transporter permease subunit, partial [Candidatus Binatia bacterium]